MVEGILSRAGENLFGHLALLNALDLRLRAAEIVVTGRDESCRRACGRARKLPFTDRILVRMEDPSRAPPAAQEKIAERMKAGGESAAFICLGETCSLPVTQPDAITEAIAVMRGY